jgi:hypothetical protein
MAPFLRCQLSILTISYFCVPVARIPEKTTQRRKQLFWLTVSEVQSIVAWPHVVTGEMFHPMVNMKLRRTVHIQTIMRRRIRVLGLW